MKKSLQSLVFALLLGVVFVSCKKSETVVPCFDEAFKGITYTNDANTKSFKIENVACKTVTLKETSFGLNGSTSFTYDVTVTAGGSGAYTLGTPGGDVSMAITTTTLNMGGAIVFVGTKK